MKVRFDDRRPWRPTFCFLTVEDLGRVFPSGPLARKATAEADAAIIRMMFGGSRLLDKPVK